MPAPLLAQLITFGLIIVLFIASVVYFTGLHTAASDFINTKDRREDEAIRAQIAQDAARAQASVPPLEPGSLFSAAITPLPNNTIRFAVKLSPEARYIIGRENLNSVRILSYPNSNYAEEKRQYDREQERLRRSPKLRDHVQANCTPEPVKQYDLTIEYFANPCGITRSFPSASEAKAWADQLRHGLKVFQRELEANETPAQPETFIVARKRDA